jgi:hypothetical protein
MFGKLLEGFSPAEKRSVAMYIAAMMLYKFAIESLGSAVSHLQIHTARISTKRKC